MSLKNSFVRKTARKVVRKLTSYTQKGSIERYYCKWNDVSPEWMAHHLIYKKFLQITDKITTLDLGCGCGAGTKLISESLGINVIGVDYSRKGINYAKENNYGKLTDYYKININFNLNKVKKLITNHSIQQVFFIEVIEHVRNPDKMVKALLESGVKKIFVSTPVSETTKREGYHLSPFTPERFNKFCQKFDVELIGYIKYIDHKNIPDEPFTNNIKEGMNFLFVVHNRH